MDPMVALIERLRNAGVPMTDMLANAMLEVDVRMFTDFDPAPFYHDRPLVFMETGSGGVKTISAPHMVATLLTHLELEEAQHVVIIGAKGGFFASLISTIIGPEGRVEVLDPSEEVLDHLRDRLHDADGISLEQITTLAEAPDQFPSELNRVLVTGAIRELPDWLMSSLADGGFIIAPIGGEVSQTLVKRERVEDEMFDTELGSVVFGPVDIKDSEVSMPSPDTLADVLEEAASFAAAHQAMEQDVIEKMRDLVVELRSLPEGLPPPDEDEDMEELHPLVEILESAQDWLAGLWPLLSTMFNIRIQSPGAPDSESPSGFSGGHEDLVP